MKTNDLINLSRDIRGDILFDYSIKKLNWFNIGGKTKIFFKPYDLQDLIKFLKTYNNRGKIFVLGAGSNILFTDEIFDGVIIKLGKRFNNISKLSENRVIAGSIVLDKNLSNFAEQNEIGSLEFLSCIPGSVGGGIRMNSGCYNREFKDILVSVQAIDFEGNILSIPSKNIEFKYRSINLSKNLIFLSGTFEGIKKEKELISKEITKLKEKKKKSQPSKVKTGGSTFKNPDKILSMKAWEVIKNSVPENIHFGDASISNEHSNFFVNKNNAKFKDMVKLIEFVKQKVKEKYKISLDLEIEIIK